MDARLFRLPTQPNLYGKPIADSRRVLERHTSEPTPDSRFSGAATQMTDGRLGTDWRPHCCQNIPAGSQYATSQWMQKNTDTIINVSRQRFVESVGGRGYDTTVEPPPAATVSCDATRCSVEATHLPHGIGTARMEAVPELFGTFAAATGTATPFPPITRRFEGGRNTPRGRHALGTQGMSP